MLRRLQVSSHIEPSTWNCLDKDGYSYAVMRAYKADGYPDPNAIVRALPTARGFARCILLHCLKSTCFLPQHSLYNWYQSDQGKSGGAASVYLFPDRNVDDPASQVSGLVTALKNANIYYSDHPKAYTYDRIWLDIEIEAWSGDKAANVRFIQGLIQGCKNNGVPCGVYTNEYNWSTITGGWTGASDLPLWYAHYDGVESCSDFAPFGGWSRAAKKQWKGNVALCGGLVDLNIDC